MQSHDYLLSMKISVSIVWFKRDLRVHDHAALSAAKSDGSPILPLLSLNPIIGNNQRHRAAIGILSMIV